ncbi:hypothetical protein QUF90_17535 [Desulfococcaceae bacterium HSG9]|nr:hypothetical protein [Desulfococcaceae bacterium HSG9]
MRKKKGRCVNVGGCDIADEQTLLEIQTNEEFICPECKDELKPDGGGFNKNILFIPLGVILLLFIFFAITNIKTRRQPGHEPSPDEPTPPPEPSLDAPSYLPTVEVPQGELKLPDYLTRYARYLDPQKPVKIDRAFTIQAGEVTVGEFRVFFDTLNESEQKLVGLKWAQAGDTEKYDDDRPVENISWVNLNLPTTAQWIAACIKYEQLPPIINQTDNIPESKLRSKVDHLIGNLREWSSDTCKENWYRLLGENYMTAADPDIVGKENCAKSDQVWPGVGFRLVRIED